MRNLYLDGLLAGDDQQVQRVQRIVAQDGVVREAEILFGAPVAGYDEAGDPVATPTGVPTPTVAPTSTPKPTATPGPTPTPTPGPGPTPDPS